MGFFKPTSSGPAWAIISVFTKKLPTSNMPPFISRADSDRLQDGMHVRLKVGGRFLPGRRERNVIADLPGREDGHVIVSAHFDSVWRGPGAIESLRFWNQVAIDASGLDHTPLVAGETRVFGEQLGPGRSSRAMAIVHIAIFDAVNAIAGRYNGYTSIAPASRDTAINAAIAQAAHDTLSSLYPSQRVSFDAAKQMERSFATVAARASRLFAGAPMFIGHPDVPQFANQFTDRKAYGWIMALEARPDGLYGDLIQDPSLPGCPSLRYGAGRLQPGRPHRCVRVE